MMLTITDPKLHKLYDYWFGKRKGRRYPARADLDPIEMRNAMGNIMLVEVLGEASLRFRIRLHGTNLVPHHGGDLTGKMMDELPATERRELVIQTFEQVATTGEPRHAHRKLLLDGQWARYESIVLPLSGDGASVNMLLVGQIYFADQIDPAVPPRSLRARPDRRELFVAVNQIDGIPVHAARSRS